MTAKRSRPRQPHASASGGGASAPPPGPPGERWGGFFLGQLLGATVGRFINLIAAVVLGVGGVFLTLAWQSGPQRALNALKFSKLTARVDGRIVESWLAVELEPKEMGHNLRWRAFAMASPCAVVEYQADWDVPKRRAFCGNRFKFRDEYTLHDLVEMAPRVPFAWARDARGFIVPEIRIGAAGREWLATHSPQSTFMLSKPPPKTALEELRLDLDRPVDDAIAGWSARPPTFALVLDPKSPAGALPAGFVENRPPPNWVAFLLAGVPGLLLWYEGMAILFGDLPRAVGLFLVVLPLVLLPWWGEKFPQYLRSLHKGFAGVVADMLGDIDPLGRLIACDPADATLAGGERLIWPAGDGAYADTFGRFRFKLPEPAPRSADDALAALAYTVARQARALGEQERIEIFSRLTRDKVNGLRGAGLVFLPAAKEAVLDPGGDPALGRAAAGFLWAWVTQPIEEPHPRDPGYQGRLRLYRELGDLPIPEIADSARSIAERGGQQ